MPFRLVELGPSISPILPVRKGILASRPTHPTINVGGSRLRAAVFSHLAATYPHISEIATAGSHDEDSTVGQGCDDQFEFEFGLDVLLDGFERRHQQGWNSTGAGCGTSAGGVPALLVESFEPVEEDVEAELELELVVAALTDGGVFVM